jgi:hypothetical protein
MPEIKTMYLAVAYGGKWDDSWETNCVASFDRHRIEQYIAKKEAEITENDRVMVLLDAFDNQYQDASIQPEYVALIDTPKWVTGLGENEITQDMRRDRANIKGRNSMIATINAARYHEWSAKREVARKEYFKTIETTLEYDNVIHSTEENYRIDEIEVI